MWNNTRVTKKLGIQYPIIQGPFGGRFSSAKLVASVSNSGGMGSFGLNNYGPDEILAVSNEIRALTNKPFALNLWVPLKNDPVQRFSERDFEKLCALFNSHFKELQVALPQRPNPIVHDFNDQVEAVLEAKPPVMSFIFGVPDQEIIRAFKKRDITLIGTATNVEEALAIEEAGMDMIVASGSSAGGHRPSFLSEAEDTLLDTSQLVRQLVKATDLPVIAAGGITVGVDVYKMLTLGASAVQMGTAFLATQESNASELHKQKLLTKEGLKTSLTKVFTGRLARVLDNTFSSGMNSASHLFAPYPIQSSFLSPLRQAALEKGRHEFIAFWSGQPSEPLSYTSAEHLFNRLIEDLGALYL